MIDWKNMSDGEIHTLESIDKPTQEQLDKRHAEILAQAVTVSAGAAGLVLGFVRREAGGVNIELQTSGTLGETLAVVTSLVGSAREEIAALSKDRGLPVPVLSSKLVEVEAMFENMAKMLMAKDKDELNAEFSAAFSRTIRPKKTEVH